MVEKCCGASGEQCWNLCIVCGLIGGFGCKSEFMRAQMAYTSPIPGKAFYIDQTFLTVNTNQHPALYRSVIIAFFDGSALSMS